MTVCSRRTFIAATAAGGWARSSLAKGLTEVPHLGPLLWSRRFGHIGSGDDPAPSIVPAADQKHLYLALSDRVLAIDLETGRPAWPGGRPADDGAIFEITDGARESSHPAATWAALSEGRLITLTGSINQRPGEAENLAMFPTLAAFDVATAEGKLLWTQGVDGQLATSGWRTAGLPVVVGDSVWFAVINRHKPEQLALASVNVATGVPRGLAVLPTQIASGVSWSAAPPVGVSEKLIGGLSNGALVAVLQKDQQVVWFSEETRSDLRPSTSSAGLLAGGNFVYTASPDRRIRAVDIRTGRLRWSFDLREPDPQVCCLLGEELICAGQRVWRLDARTGSPLRRWGFEDLPVAGRVAVSAGGIIWSTGRELIMCDRLTSAVLDRRRFDPSLATAARDVWAFGSHLVTVGGARVAVFDWVAP